MRRIRVHSTANAAGQQAARNKRLAKAAEDLNKLTAAAGGRHYKTREKIVARIGVIAAKCRVTSCLRWTVTDNQDGTLAAPPPHPPPVITTQRYHRLRDRADHLTDRTIAVNGRRVLHLRQSPKSVWP